MQVQTEVLTIPRMMTEAEFDAWIDEDVWAEFKDGEVILRMPALLKHELLFKFLLFVLELFVTRRNLGMVVGSQVMIRLRPGLRRVPDVVFVSKEREAIIGASMIEGAPDLVIEIVSPDSLARDWRDKYAEYQGAGVQEYWVFDPQSQHTEWYHLNEQGLYELLDPQEGILRSKVLDGFWLRDEWLWQEPMPDPLQIARELGLSI